MSDSSEGPYVMRVTCSRCGGVAEAPARDYGGKPGLTAAEIALLSNHIGHAPECSALVWPMRSVSALACP
jgi:hypothetical protein